MASIFATLQSRTNAAIFARLANVTATVGGVPDIPGIFDNDSATVDFMSGTRPVLQVLEADVGDVVQGTAVVIDGTSYTVSNPQPDGTGVLVLTLSAT